jgi:hypothetical protein
MKIYIFLLALTCASSCAKIKIPQFEKDVEFRAETSEKPFQVKKREFWVVDGGGKILRNTSEASISVWVRQSDQKQIQDIISFSTGGRNFRGKESRVAIRIYPNGKLAGIARALDHGPEQVVMTKAVIQKDKWHHVFLSIDYAKDEMIFYVDGLRVPSKGDVNFRGKATSDTDSLSVTLGAEEDGSGNYVAGEIKDVRVWRRKLTEENIRAVWKRINPGEKLMMGL